MIIERLFDLLDDWRKLPAYQLERRADIFFALYLDRILEKLHGIKIDLIVPEFPVRVGEIVDKRREQNMSFKVDYFAFSNNAQRVFLIELKTDQRSLRNKQDWYLENAVKLKVSGLISGLLKIYRATKQKNKYDRLLEKLEAINWIDRANNEILSLNCQIKPEVFYIQPINIHKKKNVISFDEIISVLSEIDDPIAKRFLKSLENWKIDTNHK